MPLKISHYQKKIWIFRRKNVAYMHGSCWGCCCWGRVQWFSVLYSGLPRSHHPQWQQSHRGVLKSISTTLVVWYPYRSFVLDQSSAPVLNNLRYSKIVTVVDVCEFVGWLVLSSRIGVEDVDALNFDTLQVAVLPAQFFFLFFAGGGSWCTFSCCNW